MERKIYSIIILLILSHFTAFGQSDKTIYNAFVNGDMQSWKKRIDLLEKQTKKTHQQRLDLVNYQYGYIGWCVDQGKKKEARDYIEKAEAHLEYLESVKYKLSDNYAYRAGFIGFEIGLAKHKAPFIGQKSMDYAEKAVKTNKKGIMGHIQLGNIEFYMPAAFGGSKDKAIKHYLGALQIMEANPSYTINNWNYLNLLSILITAYNETNQKEKAKYYCQKARKIEPKFKWINKDLCPN
jgi:tetratricopeptide (TPR) repeat protein